MDEEINQINQLVSRFADLGVKVERASEEAEIVNRRENILKWKPRDYQEVEKIKKVQLLYYKVWAQGRDYYFKIPSALNGILHNIDREQLTQDLQDAWTELFKLEKSTFKINQLYFLQWILDINIVMNFLIIINRFLEVQQL